MFIHISLLLIALFGGLFPPIANGHPSARRLVDMLDHQRADEFALVELVGGLMEQMLMFSGPDGELPTEEVMSTMVELIVARTPQLFAFKEALICLVRSIIFEELQYVPLPPRAAYKDNRVCLDKSKCSGKEIKFVNKKPKKNEFLYRDSKHHTPAQLQGVFWLNYGGPCSTIVSFAETNEPGPIGTGRLFPKPTNNNFSYYFRVIGASNWAFSSADPSSCYNLVSAVDLIYGFRILEGTANDPKKFEVIPNIKLPFTCIRANIDTCGSKNVLLKFDMTLVESCESILASDDPGGVAQLACSNGAVIWKRESYFLEDSSDPANADVYYVIQVVDGSGNKLDSYNDFVESEGNTGSTEDPFANYFRSLDKDVEAKFCQFAYTSDFDQDFGSKRNITLGGNHMRRGLQRGV